MQEDLSLTLLSNIHEQTQQIKINYNNSDIEQVEMRMPQGSLFSPLQILVDVNYFIYAYMHPLLASCVY